jgi:hypothetical protein
MASHRSDSSTSVTGLGQRVLFQVTDTPLAQPETMPMASDNSGVSPSPHVGPGQQNLTQLGR